MRGRAGGAPLLFLFHALDDVLARVAAERFDEFLLGHRVVVSGQQDLLLAGDVTAGEIDGDETWDGAERLTDARFAAASHDARHGDGVVVFGLGGMLGAGCRVIFAAGERGGWQGDGQ
jgi:hypothetical protein